MGFGGRTLKAGQEEESNFGLQELVSDCDASAGVHNVQQMRGKGRLCRPLPADVCQKPGDDLVESLSCSLPRPHILNAQT